MCLEFDSVVNKQVKRKKQKVSSSLKFKFNLSMTVSGRVRDSVCTYIWCYLCLCVLIKVALC